MKMSSARLQYRFTSKPWKYNGPAAWIFVSLPHSLSKEIREIGQKEEAAWGRLKATAKVGRTEWQTSIWFDTKHNTYLLPLKAELRKREQVEIGKDIEIVVTI